MSDRPLTPGPSPLSTGERGEKPQGDDVPAPILLNLWKHHAGFLRRQIERIAGQGESALAELSTQLRLVGTDLMDLYTGALRPAEIGESIRALLAGEDRLDRETYDAWMAWYPSHVIALDHDGSRWVLRRGGDPERFVDLHPGRWSPATRRVRASVLKTAVMAHALSRVNGSDFRDVSLINQARREYLSLPPIRDLSAGEGLDIVLGLLSTT
jgi:hypothetical protein